MREHFRIFDSKITFFAFADIITAVSGMLIFITLLLATDLGKPVKGLTHSSRSEAAQQLQETLAQQEEADIEIERLQQLLEAAEAAPSDEKLEVDVKRLQLQLSEAQTKKVALDGQMANSQAAIAARDQALGLTGLKASIDKIAQEVQSIVDKDSQAHVEMQGLDQQVAHAQSQLLKLRQREGQLWLIPGKTTKEPILVTVAGEGVTIERFDHPDQGKQADADNAGEVFSSYLNNAKKTDQYVVFLIKPSGITLFHALLQSARDMGFDVGYDALEEDKVVHFSTQPPIDETGGSANESSATVSSSPTSSSSAPAASPPKKNEPQPATPAAAPPKNESWWQKLLEWMGLK